MNYKKLLESTIIDTSNQLLTAIEKRIALNHAYLFITNEVKRDALERDLVNEFTEFKEYYYYKIDHFARKCDYNIQYEDMDYTKIIILDKNLNRICEHFPLKEFKNILNDNDAPESMKIGTDKFLKNHLLNVHSNLYIKELIDKELVNIIEFKKVILYYEHETTKIKMIADFIETTYNYQQENWKKYLERFDENGK